MIQTCLFSPSLDNLFCKANITVEKLNDWFVANKVSVNVDKTCLGCGRCLAHRLRHQLAQDHEMEMSTYSVPSVLGCKMVYRSGRLLHLFTIQSSNYTVKEKCTDSPWGNMLLKFTCHNFLYCLLL